MDPFLTNSSDRFNKWCVERVTNWGGWVDSVGKKRIRKEATCNPWIRQDSPNIISNLPHENHRTKPMKHNHNQIYWRAPSLLSCLHMSHNLRPLQRSIREKLLRWDMQMNEGDKGNRYLEKRVMIDKVK